MGAVVATIKAVSDCLILRNEIGRGVSPLLYQTKAAAEQVAICFLYRLMVATYSQVSSQETFPQQSHGIPWAKSL